MSIVISAPGGALEEIDHGITGAMKVFVYAGVTHDEATDGAFALEGLEFGVQVADKDFDRAAMWRTAAITMPEACCAE